MLYIVLFCFALLQLVGLQVHANFPIEEIPFYFISVVSEINYNRYCGFTSAEAGSLLC